MSLKEVFTPDRINKALGKTRQEINIKNGQLEIITEQDYDKAMQFFEDDLLPDEPSCAAFGVGLNATMYELFLQVMKYNMSLMIVSPDNREIMAVRIMGVGNADDSFSSENEKDMPMKTLMDFWQYCDERDEFCKHYKAKEVVSFFGLGVAQKYRKQGLATQIMEATLSFLKNFGVSPIYIKGASSSQYSANVFAKLGYDLLDEVRYAEYIKDGKQVICPADEHTCLRSFGKVF